jgi:carbamoyltransferase
MLVLGIAGGIDTGYQKRFASSFDVMDNVMGHDAAAVLVDEGKVVVAIEQERLDRIKHSNNAPLSAVRFCLDDYGVGLEDVDRIAIYASERFLNARFRQRALSHPESEAYLDSRSLVRRLICQEFGQDFDSEKLVFVHHHWAHAASAFIPSGFERSLVMTIDGQGDGVSGMVFHGEGTTLHPLRSIPEPKSLGLFYLKLVRFLGFTLFEEYKVMGLAPYGDSTPYRRLFENFYVLLPDGDFLIHTMNLDELFKLVPPRRRGEPIEQVHKDIAAALQETLEKIVLHVLTFFSKKTGHTTLCLAGGVAHNCSLNGKILYSGIFSEIFVQPAAHDAGCAIGAALHVFHSLNPQAAPTRLEHVYWGTDLVSDVEMERQLERWRDLIRFEKNDDIVGQTAQLLANNSVIGWVQGRSEFGPRALGNRSILADPRPATNRELINRMVKKRETYRPFAPAVLPEYVNEYFISTERQKEFPFMLFALKVREAKRQLLGAVTHVDGTARIQTVSKAHNLRFFELIDAFGKITGVPVILNTSFNNDVEPIVNSLTEAMSCFLTTNLDYLIVGDYLISKKNPEEQSYLNLIPSQPAHIVLRQVKGFISPGEMAATYEISNTMDERRAVLSAEMFELLWRADGTKSLSDLLDGLTCVSHRYTELKEEIVDLWSRRFVRLEPPGKEAA